MSVRRVRIIRQSDNGVIYEAYYQWADGLQLPREVEAMLPECRIEDDSVEQQPPVSIEERLDQIERFVKRIAALPTIEESAALMESELQRDKTQLADDEASMTPPGVVSPHVRQNLDALAQWTDPGIWRAQPMTRKGLETILTHLNQLVATARRGEDVPLP